ncbi:LuxR family transcriptional regulator [Actinomadura viridis]|uniref:DNA-binding CsgD family transcriptional regulator/tetratricopeptide (TPR) repeat protein n=1 Tax=Actinomadura viridis TaxID=58110 RepID=A0A931DNG1_9ACTN|nr:LuxR family transcriptional regulator [Actinomadura viridis]MBG6093175.1 DNA-binding CsgD family transcriptional regulator/tetratricopeptide (TPR) repeat protein [Actinomadura viridis]
MELFGRHAETAALDELLDRAAGGAGAGLVLWGEPGIGKTALLEYAVAAASDATVLRCRGSRMEAGLAFAALHELLWPVMDRLETLAAPQAAALRGALGLSRDTTNRFLIGAAVLSLVSGLARERPVLVVVDDAQWIDEATAQCLGFLARRVTTDRVVVLLTGHEDPASGPWEGLPALEVVGLADDDARKLVATAVPGADEALADHTIRTAGGNPLALHELPTLDHEPDGDAPLGRSGDLMPVGPRLRRAFAARAAAMTPPARALLLLAAAEDRGDRHVVHRAGAGWGVDTITWDEVLRSGLLRVSGARLEFRHPLIRAAVYDGAPFLNRQAAHRALATALPAGATAERAWHLAAAADGPDEDVAALLEQAAEQCLRRSAGPMAARTLRRAAELSPTPAAAGRRLAAAARAAWDAGRAETARQLLEDAERLCGELPVARLSGGLRGILEFANGRPERAHRYLVCDMAVVPEPRRAVELGTVAVRAAWSAGRPDLQQEALQQVRAVDAGGDPDLSELLPVLRNWWSCYDQTGEVTPTLLGMASGTVGRLGAAAWELLPPVPLVQAWGIEDGLLDVLRVQAAQLRRRHELAALAVVRSQTAVLDLGAGRWGAAEAAAAEGLRLAEEVGADHVATQCHSSLGALAAARGDGRAVAEHTTRILRVSVPRGVRVLSAAAYWHRGRAALFGSRPQEALADLLCLAEPGHEAAHPTCALFAAVDTVEAAVQVGNTDVVEAQVVMVEEWAQRTGATWARAAGHRLRALVQGGAAAEASFRAALDVVGAAGDPFEYARTRLLYGEWLRRARRRADARLQLAGAAEVFDRLGAEPLRARALREQALTERPTAPRVPGPPTAAGLTAQELRVARLAADRLTNREIAAQLLISPRTVGHHLANVYTKLGIASRADLARIDFEGDLRFSTAGD